MTPQNTPAPIALPAMPNIPASNASYNKIAARLEQAAKSGQPAAVTFIRDNAIKGTNTYCRMLRRYADMLVAAISPAAPEAAEPAKKAAPAKAKKGPKAPAAPAAKPKAAAKPKVKVDA